MAMPRKTSIDDIAGECVALRLRMLNRVVTKVYEDALRPLGLKVSQMNILVAAARIGAVRPTELGELLHLDVSTLSRNVERMKARGWLKAIPADDGRSQPFKITAQGRKLLEQAVPLWDQAQVQVKQLLGGDFVKRLNHTLSSISASSAPS
jgi:DNA-binding MarR family transcriptional regulator